MYSALGRLTPSGTLQYTLCIYPSISRSDHRHPVTRHCNTLLSTQNKELSPAYKKKKNRNFSTQMGRNSVPSIISQKRSEKTINI
jgi:hypothetical protein